MTSRPTSRSKKWILIALLVLLAGYLLYRSSGSLGLSGFSAAKLGALVNRAAVIAANNRRKIEMQDLSQALAEMGGQDRPLFQPVDWEDVIVEPEVEQDLKELVSLLNGAAFADRWKIRPPTGVLLIGPPGTGKSLLARLIATETERSFYPILASDLLGGNVGDSVKKLRAIFECAKENAPSIIFFDEIDGLLPDTPSTFMSLHDVQLLDETLTQISLLTTANKVFLVGTCNHLDRIDPRALRGGRFSEKIQIGLPGQTPRRRLFVKYLEDTPLYPSSLMESLALISEGLSGADIQAVCETAKRFACRRASGNSDVQPAVIQEDVVKAVERIRVGVHSFS